MVLPVRRIFVGWPQAERRSAVWILAIMDSTAPSNLHAQLTRAGERAAAIVAKHKATDAQRRRRAPRSLELEAPTRQLDHVTSAPRFVAGTYGPLAIAIWDDALTPYTVFAAISAIEALARLESRILTLVILGPGASAPQTVRRTFQGALRRIDWQVAGVAEVIEGSALRAATMSGVATVGDAPYAQASTASITDAAEFLGSYSDGRISAAEVASAVLLLRSHTSR
jgi:hypothetical protein